MSTTHAAVLLLSLLSLFTTWLGVMLAVWLRENARAIAAGIGFSTGIMRLISLLERVPESIRIVRAPPILVSFALAAGAMSFVSLQELVPMARRYRSMGMFAIGAILSVLVYGLLSGITEAA